MEKIEGHVGPELLQHGRDVALKVLPEDLLNDPERVARFRREAQVLASLNHPHIAQIYDAHYDPHALQEFHPAPPDAELAEAATRCAGTGTVLMARGTQHLRIFAPLPYGPACVACHAPGAQRAAVWLYDLPELADD